MIAVTLREAGVPLEDIKELLRHRDIATIQTDTKASPLVNEKVIKQSICLNNGMKAAAKHSLIFIQKSVDKKENNFCPILYFCNVKRHNKFSQRTLNSSISVAMIHYILKFFCAEVLLEYIRIYSILDIEILCTKIIHRKYRGGLCW